MPLKEQVLAAPEEDTAFDPWSFGLSAKNEARLLFAMIGRNGDTVETIRELIAVPPRTERLLKAYAEQNPIWSRWKAGHSLESHKLFDFENGGFCLSHTLCVRREGFGRRQPKASGTRGPWSQGQQKVQVISGRATS